MPTTICTPIQTLARQCRTETVMSKLAGITALVLATSLSSCATPYQAQGYLNVTDGGFSEQELESGLWRVRFEGNPGTTEETVQTLWLYRCAELAMQKGFDGFAILSPIRLTWAEGGSTTASPLLLRAQFIIIPPSSSPKLEGDIRLLKKSDPVSTTKDFRCKGAEDRPRAACQRHEMHGPKCLRPHSRLS